MAKFFVGEEVRYDGEVYMISGMLTDGPDQYYRLLATRPGGTRFEIVREDRLQRMENYLTARNDTAAY